MSPGSPLELEVAPGTALVGRLEEPASASSTVALYLHGLGSSYAGEKADLFRRRFVERGVAFCAFDFRGHGDSGGSMFELTLSRNLEDVAAVRRELERRGYERIVLVGSSMGGLTGLWHAARSPSETVAALHLAPALGLEEKLAEVGAEKLERWRRRGWFEIEHELGNWQIGWQFVEDLRRHPLDELCRGYRTPTLLLQGRHDTSVPWRRVLDFAVGSAGEEIELHLFGDGDHRMIDRLDRLWRLMAEFLEGRKLLDRA